MRTSLQASPTKKRLQMWTNLTMIQKYIALFLLPAILTLGMACSPDGIRFGSPSGNSDPMAYSAGEVSTMREKKEVDKKLEEVDGVVSVGIAGENADSAWLEVKVKSREAQKNVEARASEVFEEMPVRVVIADTISAQVVQEVPMEKKYSVSEIRSLRAEKGLDEKLLGLEGVLSIGIAGDSEDDAYLEVQVEDEGMKNEIESVTEAMAADLPVRVVTGERAVVQVQKTYTIDEIKTLREEHNLDKRLLEVPGVASIGIGGNSAEDAWIQVNCELEDDIVDIQEALGDDLQLLPIRFAVSGKVVAQ